MKKRFFLLTLILPMLTACGDVSDVQGSLFPEQTVYSIGEVLNDRKICEDVNWTEQEDDRGKTIVIYQCEYKGAKAYYTEKGLDVDGVQEYHQWTMTDGGPVHLASGLLFWTPEGKSYTRNFSGRWAIKELFETALENKAQTFSDITGLGSYVASPDIIRRGLSKL